MWKVIWWVVALSVLTVLAVTLVAGMQHLAEIELNGEVPSEYFHALRLLAWIAIVGGFVLWRRGFWFRPPN